MSKIPEELKYAKSHEWVRIDGDIATIGITDYAQSELGDVVYVDLPEVGRALQTGETFGSVESVKTVSDVYAPVSGQVIDVNPVLGARSELINSDPYGEGYMLKIQLSDPADTDKLLGAAEYQEVIG